MVWGSKLVAKGPKHVAGGRNAWTCGWGVCGWSKRAVGVRDAWWRFERCGLGFERRGVQDAWVGIQISNLKKKK